MLFSELAVYLQKLESTPSRNTMTEILADLFHRAGPGEIGKICYLLQGRVAPLYEAIEFGMADRLIIRAIALAYGTDEKHVLTIFKKEGDLGSAAEKCYLRLKHGNKILNINEVYERLLYLAQAAGVGSQAGKISLLSDLLTSVDSLSVRYIVRIPIDKLRLGFSDMTILDALSWMLKGDKTLRIKLEDAYNLRPDIGYLAETIKREGINGLSRVKVKIGVPILAALCQRLPTADEMIKKMGKVAVEPKYDGVRVQIHYQKSKIKNQRSKVQTKSYSRNLENTTAMFPELQNIGKQVKAREVILDSEAIGLDPKTGRLIPFQETVTRKRKYDIQLAILDVPLKFFVFDILYYDGQDLLAKPLSERRVLLEKIVTKGNQLIISPQIVTGNPQELRDYHDQQLKHGLEGVVVKKWNSPYEPGRRGYSWVKFKQEEGKTGKLADTIDAVIMGYYRGQGKRTSFGIGAFLVGVKKGEGFVTLTKIGTGVSDELWKELEVKLHKLQIKEMPRDYLLVNKTYIPDVWVEPQVVVEIAGDDLTKSPIHGAGIAVRFPRLVRLRSDKSFGQITTVSEIEQMYKNQKTAKI